MNLNQLRIFATVFEKKGFSAASRELNISPTAVSKQIRQLEEDLGIQLFYRTSTQFEVSEQGADFYSKSKSILDDMDTLKDSVLSSKGIPTGSIKVFATQAYASRFIVSFMEEFCRLYPQVRLNLDIADRIPDVQQEGIDLCFGLLRHWDQDLIQKKLFSTQYGVYAARSYLEESGWPETPQDLRQHKFILHGRIPDASEIEFIDGDKIEVTPYVSVSDHHALIKLVEDGVGLATLLDYMVDSLKDTNELVRVLPDYEMPRMNFFTYYSTDRYKKPAAQVFLKFIEEKTR